MDNGRKHTSPPEKEKDVSEIILGSIGDINTARLQNIKCQFTC